jgi:hypothetical protein
LVRLADPVDQATGLRRLFAGVPVFRAAGILGPDSRRNARVCAALAQGLSRRGNQVLVLDEARAPYNVGGMMGLLSRRSLADVPHVRLTDAALEAGPGIRLLAAPEGVEALASLSEQSLLDMAEHWGDAPEWMLVNSPGGAHGTHRAGLATTSQVRILVLPGDKNWLAEAYATLKSAHAAWSGGVWVVLVEGAELDRAQRLYNSLKDTALRFLGFAPDCLGCLPSSKESGGGDEGFHGGLLAETLQGLRVEDPINFEQYWQRLWLFSRMAVEPPVGKGRNASRHPG